MKRTSTPSFEIELPWDYATYVSRFIATFAQHDQPVIVKTEADIGAGGVTVEGNILTIALTQEETQQFTKGAAAFELKVYTPNRKVPISDTAYFKVEDVLNNEVFT